MIWAISAIFSFSYLWGIIRKKDDWTETLSLVNIRMGFVVMATLLAVNSPLLDFRKITVASQMARLESGAVSYEDFDYSFLAANWLLQGIVL